MKHGNEIADRPAMVQNGFQFSTIPSALASKKLITVFSFVVFATFVARAQTIVNPLYAIDTYSSIDLANDTSWYRQMFEQGRYGFAAIWWLGRHFDFGHFDEAVYGFALAAAFMSATGIILSAVINNAISPSHSLIFSLVFCLHPFMNEFFHFSDDTLTFSLAMLLSSAGICMPFLHDRQKRGYVAGSLFVALSLSIYQTVLSYVLVASLMSIVNAMCQRSIQPGFKGVLRAARYLSVTVAGVSAYFLIIVLVNYTFSIHVTSRFDLSALLDIKERVHAALLAVDRSFRPVQGFATKTESFLLFLMIVASVVIIVVRSFLAGNVLSVVCSISMVSMCLLISTSLTSVSKDLWLVPRTLSGFAVFSGAVIASACTYLSPRSRLFFGICVSVLVSCYIGLANRTIHDQVLVNRWDQAQANRIVERLEENEHFNDIRSLALVGGFWARTVPLSSVWGDMNISAYGASWAKLGIIEQATGLKFEAPSNTMIQNAADYCREHEIWPAPSSIGVIHDLGVVCLTKPS